MSLVRKALQSSFGPRPLTAGHEQEHDHEQNRSNEEESEDEDSREEIPEKIRRKSLQH